MIIQLSPHSIITINNYQLSNCRIVDNPGKQEKSPPLQANYYITLNL